MLNIILYLIALITGMLAFSGAAGMAGATMMAGFQISLVLLVLSMLTRGFTRGVVVY